MSPTQRRTIGTALPISRGIWARLRSASEAAWKLRSPLRLRYSYAILRDWSPTPLLSWLRLLWPIPWHFSTRLPENPRYLQQNPELVAHRNDRVYDMTLMPMWRGRDSPQRSFYRMYENFCAEQGVLLGYETEYFWKHAEPAWALRLLPKPRACGHPDLQRDAVMASFLEDVVNAFNWRLELGLRRGAPLVERADDGTPAPFVPERCPDWVAQVGPLPETLLLHEDWDMLIPGDDAGASVHLEPYRKRNIVAGDTESGINGYLRTG
ncbi:Uu.00g033110.m01.CDS01 [Anthostomella pinea]|uniref:Uu.00g033110.m01.CDS01 n=1 Tax=Anthostomella pinea TaxID=933095 RepID=A0AAI8V8V8_9PEZI|nr:Uu.00g033110.m01.CDS01 [Anthostomella pinea]